MGMSFELGPVLLIAAIGLVSLLILVSLVLLPKKAEAMRLHRRYPQVQNR